VKHKRFKMLQLLYFLKTKLSAPPFCKFFQHLKKHITLLTSSLLCPAARVPVTSLQLRNCWTFYFSFLYFIWHSRVQLIAQLMDSASSRLRADQRRTFWTLTFASWVSGHWSSEAMFQIRRICFSNRLTIHKVMIIVRHSFVIRSWYSECGFSEMARNI